MKQKTLINLLKRKQINGLAILLINFLFLSSMQLISAMEYGNTLYSPGWWFGMSNDSFGFGIPSEADDHHTVGFQGGYKSEFLSGTLQFDLFTNRGTSEADHTRTDRLKLILDLQDTLNLGKMEFLWRLSGSLGVDGKLGGYWVQHIFHYAFLNYRIIPDISDYDSTLFFFGLQPYGELVLPLKKTNIGLEFNTGFYYPWLITIDPGIFLQTRRGNSQLRLSAAWLYTPMANDYRTFNLARELTAGLWLTGYLESGRLFYHFSYNPIAQLTDGRIGYQWTKNAPSSTAQSLWDMLEVGIELMNLGPQLVYEENTLFQMLFRTTLPGGYTYVIAKNGGQYVDRDYTYNGKNVAIGGGYEQHIPLKDDFSMDPFIGMGLFAEHAREHTFGAYRSTTVGEMGIVGSEIRLGMGFWVPKKEEVEELTGFRLTAFALMPHFTFGPGYDSPGLAPIQGLRWGIRAGIISRP